MAASCEVGRCCGWQPASKVSMMIMRPPQHGHGVASVSEAAGSSIVRCQGSGEQLAGLGQVLLSGGAGEQAVVADAMEAFRQDVQQKAADKLGRRERHGGVAAGPFDPVVLDLEGDAVLVSVEQAPAGDSDAMGVARQISQYCVRPGEGPLGIDEPARAL